MLQSRIVPGDGRIITLVTINVAKSAKIRCELIADGGTTWTLIPEGLINSYFSSGQISVGWMVKTNFGHIVSLTGITLEIVVEDFGRGNPQIRRSKKVYAHFLNNPHNPFLSTCGLLGMDSFDDVDADPVKDGACTAAYLAKRI